MNRPVFAYSGANPGVTDWINSAASSDVLVDFTALHNPCYVRSPDRPGPHNLLLDPTCAVNSSTTAGPARPLWHDRSRRGPHRATSSLSPTRRSRWRWTASSSTGPGTPRRARTCDPRTVSHTSPSSGAQISARNVVEISTVYVPSPADARSPTPITVGTGTAVVHRNGTAIPVIWSRATAVRPVRVLRSGDRSADPTRHRHHLHRAERARDLRRRRCGRHVATVSRAGRRPRAPARGRRGCLPPTSG